RRDDSDDGSSDQRPDGLLVHGLSAVPGWLSVAKRRLTDRAYAAAPTLAGATLIETTTECASAQTQFLSKPGAGSFKRLSDGALLGRQSASKLDRHLNPLAQLCVGLEARRPHQNPAFHRPPRKIEAPRIGSLERPVGGFRRQPYDQLRTVHAHAHVA